MRTAPVDCLLVLDVESLSLGEVYRESFVHGKVARRRCGITEQFLTVKGVLYSACHPIFRL